MSTPHKSKYTGGSILRGTPEERRHLYDWDLGKGLGMHCRKCGLPKPPWTADETECIGHHLATKTDLLEARGKPRRGPDGLTLISTRRANRETGTILSLAFQPSMS